MKKSAILAGLAMSAMAGMVATSTTIDNNQTSIERGLRINNQKELPSQNQNPLNTTIKQFQAPKIETEKLKPKYAYKDSGIPPKIYGMHYVKRGTHKKNNI